MRPFRRGEQNCLCHFLQRCVDRLRHGVLDRTASFALRFGIYGNARRVSRFALECPAPSRKKHMQRKRTALRRSRRVRVRFPRHEPCQNCPCKAGKRPNALLRFCLSFRILPFRFAPPLYCTRRKHCANALSCGAGPCGGPSASSEAEGLLASSLKRYPAMHTQFSRGAVIGTVLFLIAVAVPCKAQAQAQAQSYPIAEARAAYWEVSANAQELSARAWNAWALAGGTVRRGL